MRLSLSPSVQRLIGRKKNIGQNDKSIECWKSALNALPKQGLTPAELKQKEQYAEGLKNAQAKVPERAQHYVTKDHRTPWALAEKLYPELVAGGPAMYSSSASCFVQYQNNLAELAAL